MSKQSWLRYIEVNTIFIFPIFLGYIGLNKVLLNKKSEKVAVIIISHLTSPRKSRK